jgi:hypothetical protein
MSGQTIEGTSRTSGSPAGSSQGPRLSQAIDIEYKAFTRSFLSGADTAAVLLLMASCWHTTNGFSLYFEKDGDNYKLMEQPPTGIFLHLYTYYSASWPTQGISGEADQIPKQVTVTDARGAHSIAVHPWA